MSTPGTSGSSIGRRLIEVDALRGLAALAVVLFHYTTRIQQLYPSTDTPSVSFPHGHYGVNLFFIVSGFVIFMTLDRTSRSMDFVVSRFSRLFPTYWAAVILTFAVTSAFGLPGKEVSLLHAVANLIMVHGIFNVPHVDGVYWTLEVEMLFYAGMLGLFATGRLHRVHVALWSLLALRLIYELAARAGTDLSWTLSRLLILNYIPWFALGICIYEWVMRPGRQRPLEAWSTAVIAIGGLLFVDGWLLAALAAALGLLVWGASSGRLPWLANPVLAFFGAISYPLYLIHENIGWVLQRWVIAQGWAFDVSVLLALALSIALATALTRSVERPALRAIRTAYRQRVAAAAS